MHINPKCKISWPLLKELCHISRIPTISRNCRSKSLCFTLQFHMHVPQVLFRECFFPPFRLLHCSLLFLKQSKETKHLCTSAGITWWPFRHCWAGEAQNQFRHCDSITGVMQNWMSCRGKLGSCDLCRQHKRIQIDQIQMLQINWRYHRVYHDTTLPTLLDTSGL